MSSSTPNKSDISEIESSTSTSTSKNQDESQATTTITTMGVNEKDDDEYEADVASLTAALESKVNVTESDTNDEQDQTQEKASGQSPPKAAAAATTTTIEAAPAALHAIAQWLHDAQSILVLTGAGVSVAAGIPDFRTPGTGLYDNLSKYNLPYAEAVFDIDYYPRHPQAFVQLANELWPDPNTIAAPKPTLTHCFVALLAEKGKLLRNYSQNIDGLEHMAGLPTDKLVECHGHFRTASCVQCKRPAPIESVRKAIVDECQPPLCSFCNDDNPRNKESPSSSSKPNRRLSGRRPVYTKPDIVFFGEDLPPRFHQLLPKDLHKADLCLILGTSLQVPPTAHIPDRVHASCKRVLLNRELVGNLNVKNVSKNPSVVNRDAFYAGDCDDSILWIARILGWELELLERHAHTKKADVRLL